MCVCVYVFVSSPCQSQEHASRDADRVAGLYLSNQGRSGQHTTPLRGRGIYSHAHIGLMGMFLDSEGMIRNATRGWQEAWTRCSLVLRTLSNLCVSGLSAL